MKNALLLLVLLLPALTYGQQADSTGFKSQKEVVYPVSNIKGMSAAVAWYSAFFGQKPQSADTTSKIQSALFNIDGVVVRLSTDSEYMKLNDPLFYWVLPTPDAVTAKFNALKGNSRFNRGFVKRMRHHGGVRRPRQRTDGKTSKKAVVEEVIGFIVYDPEGNQVGVINNPIYKPRR